MKSNYPNPKWSSRAKELSKELHMELSLSEGDWHKFKNNNSRRAAEHFSAALVQLLSEGNLVDIEEQVLQGIRWLKKEVSSPGCPGH